MQLPVEVVLDKVRRGDREAFAEIVRRYQPDVARVVAYALCDPEAARDLVQQAFVNAYTALDRFESGRDFGPWIRTLARNLVRNELRRRGREQAALRHYLRWYEDCVAEGGAAESGEEGLRRDLDACRALLAPASAQALSLRYEEGRSFGELSQALGKTVEACRQLLGRIRVALRDCIEGRRMKT